MMLMSKLFENRNVHTREPTLAIAYVCNYICWESYLRHNTMFDHPLEVLEIGYAADTRKELKGDPEFLNS